MSFNGDWLMVVGHTSSFSLELWPVEDYHSLYSFFLCCLLLYLFIFGPGFQDIIDCLFYTIYTSDLLSKRQLSWANMLSLFIWFFSSFIYNLIIFLFLLLVLCVLKQNSSIHFPIFERFVPYAKYLTAWFVACFVILQFL